MKLLIISLGIMLISPAFAQDDAYRITQIKNRIFYASPEYSRGMHLTSADWNFIVEARKDVPWLVKQYENNAQRVNNMQYQIRELEDKIKRMKQILECIPNE